MRPSVTEAGGTSADPIRWARVKRVFDAASELPLAERPRFVAAECADDVKVLADVKSLLACDAAAGDFLEKPAAACLPATSVAPRFGPGQAVGRYQIVAFLGAGAMSEVYRAHDTRLGRDVALKLVNDPQDADAGRRLLTEAQHASILNHPNVCAVYEAEEGNGQPFIALELVDGPTLHEILRTRRVRLDEAVSWATDIAAALDHAHRRGIIHRDLKSANVALSSDGTTKVLDFGLSRRIAVDTGGTAPAFVANASVAGTLTHIAPEVLQGLPIDHRVDLWALGVMLYELITGTLPFRRATPIQTADAIVRAAAEPLPDAVPRAVRQVIERCLEKDPARRYRSAAELRDVLLAARGQGRATVGRQRASMMIAGVLAAALIAALGLPWWTAPPRPVVAVLPFEVGDATETFFADGVAEALVAGIGRIDGMRVLAASTTLRRPRPATSARAAARRAGASRLLEGSVVRSGTRVRLRTQLLDATTERVLWTEEYERSAREIEALQALVVINVAGAMQVGVGADDARHFAAVRAADPDVYEAYLKGRYYWNQRTIESIRTAVSYYEKALKLDPTYAPAYAALADCYNQLGTVMIGGGSPGEWRPKAAAAAIRALQIDPSLGEAHATLGYVRHYDWQWAEAERSFRRAIELNPNNALARIWYANFLCSRLRLDEAVREVLIARELDPLSLIVNTNVGWVFAMARRNEEAVVHYRAALALDPRYPQAQSRLASAYLELRQFDHALETSLALARDNQRLVSVAAVEQVRMLAGQPNVFERTIDELAARQAEDYVSPGTIANFYFTLGGRRDEDAFAWLEQGYRQRTNNIAYLAVESTYDRVRSDPRFRALVTAVGLP